MVPGRKLNSRLVAVLLEMIDRGFIPRLISPCYQRIASWQWIEMSLPTCGVSAFTRMELARRLPPLQQPIVGLRWLPVKLNENAEQMSGAVQDRELVP